MLELSSETHVSRVSREVFILERMLVKLSISIFEGTSGVGVVATGLDLADSDNSVVSLLFSSIRLLRLGSLLSAFS